MSPPGSEKPNEQPDSSPYQAPTISDLRKVEYADSCTQTATRHHGAQKPNSWSDCWGDIVVAKRHGHGPSVEVLMVPCSQPALSSPHLPHQDQEGRGQFHTGFWTLRSSLKFIGRSRLASVGSHQRGVPGSVERLHASQGDLEFFSQEHRTNKSVDRICRLLAMPHRVSTKPTYQEHPAGKEYYHNRPAVVAQS
ncbi:hypothetical protein K491DRAFT_675364 [Lophiostoma macrostomum CBS 122681]|uniref:Uncharacterized protein n=1 Tax=Lophiostoma macrostomum CBS 122681 TaxID=1314788 RepID=A0A6A6TK82_9PLEO|nr:hypothetical protein K491DRAFT_675364 [Lophiostoma macrostomum CBS 122681]